MKNWMKMLLLSMFAVSVAACNTVEGVGQDVEEVGEEIEETADNNK
ncbi:entericidin A/B family lipoprotein [Ponticaulis profundi]|uniref:Entericidin A/B family lipoprotein n=1 Tax=Ponticaulis profundi TaxID=2665222 RepID=A0ABW1SFP6_9PROT|tara:strand:- start:285 stop:422 length:138 start_codon:yes stop_codon:yes gene_type:complete